MSHYQRLNIQPDADTNTIKTAYYSLSKIYHPDIADPNDATAVEKFRLITESYNALSDPQLRREYDAQFYTAPVTNYHSEIFNRGDDSSRDNSASFRVRDADLLFRAKQDAAMEREKRLNPKKFRAGTFKDDANGERFATQDELDRLQRRIDTLGSSKTGDDFYRDHLYLAIQRRHAGLMNARSMNYQGSNNPADSGIISFLTGVGIIALLGITLFNITVDYDIGAYLDSKLSSVPSKSDDKDDAKSERN